MSDSFPPIRTARYADRQEYTTYSSIYDVLKQTYMPALTSWALTKSLHAMLLWLAPASADQLYYCLHKTLTIPR